MGGFIGATNLRASKNGVNVGSRSKVNFVEGANVTLTITDDTVNDEIDITIEATGGGGGGGVSDGDKGDITVSGGGTVWTIDNDVIDGDNIVDGEISTGKLSDDAVTTSKISGEAVTTEKIAPSALYGRIWTAQKGYLFM